MAHTKGNWEPDFSEYTSKPNKIYTGIKVEMLPNYYQRIFDTILPETDEEYDNEHKEIKANVHLASAAPDMLDALVALKDYCKYHKILLGSGIIYQIEMAINKALNK